MSNFHPELILGILALVAGMVLWFTARREVVWRWASLGTLLWAASHISVLISTNPLPLDLSQGLKLLGLLGWLMALRSLREQVMPKMTVLMVPVLGLGIYGLYVQLPLDPGQWIFTAVVLVGSAVVLFSLPLFEAALQGKAPEARLVWGAGLMLKLLSILSLLWLGAAADPFTNYVCLLAYVLLGWGAYLELHDQRLSRTLMGFGMIGLLSSSALLAHAMPLLKSHLTVPTWLVWSYAVMVILGGWGLTVYGRILKAERQLDLWVSLLENLSSKPQSTQNLAPQGVLQTVLDGLGPLFTNLVGLEVKSDVAIKAGQSGPYVHTLELALDTPTEARIYFSSPPQDERGLEALAPLLTERLKLSLTLNEWRSKAYSDPLTNLLNRRGYERHMQRLVRLSQETRKPITVAVLDLDRFKRVNDTYGHPVGDEVLKELAALLRKFSRNDDLAVRFGGEEFGLVLFGATIEDAHRVLERVRTEMKTIRINPIPWTLTLSGGIAGGDIPTSMATVGRWVEAADQALYEAKQEGRDRVYSANGAAARAVRS